MTHQMRFTQLISYNDLWDREEPAADLAVYILAGIGYIRRSGLKKEEIAKVRAIEVRVRASVELFLSKFEEFISDSDLDERAMALTRLDYDNGVLSEDSKNLLIDFYQDRDDLELAWQVVMEYSDDEEAKNWRIIGRIRDFLDDVDDTILLEENIIKQLQHIGNLESVIRYDPDYFWWLNNVPELPQIRYEQYLASYMDDMMPSEFRTKFFKYLLSKDLCSDLLPYMTIEENKKYMAVRATRKDKK